MRVNARFTHETQNTFLMILAGLVVDAAVAEEAKVTPLLSKELNESPGKEGLIIAVEYPPGNTGPIRSINCSRHICLRKIYREF